MEWPRLNFFGFSFLYTFDVSTRYDSWSCGAYYFISSYSDSIDLYIYRYSEGLIV